MKESQKVAYPPWQQPFVEQCKSLFYESGVVGTLLFLASFNSYQNSVQFLRTFEFMNDSRIFALLVAVSHLGIWIFCNIPFLMFDTYGYFQKYKLYRSSAQIPTQKMLRQTLIEAGISLFLTGPSAAYFIYPYLVILGLTPLDSPMPSLLDIYSDVYSYLNLYINPNTNRTILIGHIFNDIMFYLSHRMLHSKPLYWIHKQHHSYAGTIGISAEFANPIEVIFSNIVPTVGGVVFFGCHHPLSFIITIVLRTHQTYYAHSGYCFKGTWLDFFGLAHAQSAIFHDHHHTSNVGNFGYYYLDYMFGTMDHFNAGGLHDGYLNRKKKV